MEVFSLSSSISIAASKLPNRNHGRASSKDRSSNLRIYCQSGNRAIKSTSGLSSVWIETSSPSSSSSSSSSSALIRPANADLGPTLVEGGNSLVLSPNGKEVSTSVTDMNDPGQGEEEVEGLGIGIVQFLKGKTFLITGATGFLGKVLVEKILRTAPDVHKIFFLVKANNNESALERLKNDIINAELFTRLRQIHGKCYQGFMLSKLIPVPGNMCETNLGLDEDAVELLSREVDVIINSAANTTFDERYDTALDINTGGPARLMRFAKQCQKLNLFLQISTAYVNGQRQGRIMEKPFCMGQSITTESGSEKLVCHHQHQLPFSVEDEIKIVLESKRRGTLGLAVDEDDASVIQNMKELGMQRAKKFGWQDTYVFTKAMGEMMIDSLRGDIPVVVIRPSVIESTFKEPFPGWMEGNRMMDPIILHYGKGQLTGFLVDPNGVLDVVPADMVVNAILAAIAKHGATGKPDYSIYQVASSVVNPLVFRDLAKLLYQHFTSAPFIDSTGAPIHVQKMKLFSSMNDFSTHLWRDAIQRTGLAALTNLDGKLSKKLEIICRKSVEQAKYLANIYESYTFYGGRFDNSNTRGLMGCMSKEERQQFGFDVEDIDWKDYISNIHIPGLRRHVLKGRGLSS